MREERIPLSHILPVIDLSLLVLLVIVPITLTSAHLFEILISLPTSWPAIWHPAALLPETWDALVLPFFALPFWWLVGCGLDALIAKERLHWSLLLIGTLLAASCLALLLGFHAGISTAEQEASPWRMRGLAGWTIAFAVLPIAWIVQSTRQRRRRDTGPM
jgi:hypothetical protein